METLPTSATLSAELTAPIVHSGHGAPPTLVALSDAAARDLVQLFKLLADETRLRIMHYLMQISEMNVRTFVGLLGQTQPAVSHHLALLREAGMIECRRSGKHNFYHLVRARCESLLQIAFSSAIVSAAEMRPPIAAVTVQHDGQTY
jgi:ArsR family transcriptional regulator